MGNVVESHADGRDVFFSKGWAKESAMAKRLVAGLRLQGGFVGYSTFRALNEYLRGNYGFNEPYAQDITNNGNPTGFLQWFYQFGSVWVRIKNQPRARRSESAGHMAVVIATGPSWWEEVAKVSSTGELLPKSGFTSDKYPKKPFLNKPNNNWKVLCKIGASIEAILAAEDRWADAAHFDFIPEFDWAGAERYI